jgi:hypothetical protein
MASHALTTGAPQRAPIVDQTPAQFEASAPAPITPSSAIDAWVLRHEGALTCFLFAVVVPAFGALAGFWRAAA